MRSSISNDSGPDAVRMYLNEIGQVDLLTAEDERRLGKLIKDGIAAQVSLEASGGNLGLRERRALQREIKEGEKAKEQFFHTTDLSDYKLRVLKIKKKLKLFQPINIPTFHFYFNSIKEIYLIFHKI